MLRISWLDIVGVKVNRRISGKADCVYFEIIPRQGSTFVVHERFEGYATWEQELESRLPGYDVEWRLPEADAG